MFGKFLASFCGPFIFKKLRETKVSEKFLEICQNKKKNGFSDGFQKVSGKLPRGDCFKKKTKSQTYFGSLQKQSQKFKILQKKFLLLI